MGYGSGKANSWLVLPYSIDGHGKLDLEGCVPPFIPGAQLLTTGSCFATGTVRM